MRRDRLVFLLLAIMVVCGVMTTTGCRQSDKLIPREAIFGPPDRSLPRVSPEGQYVSYLAPQDGVLNVWVRALDSRRERILSDAGEYDLYYYFWVTDKWIVYIQPDEHHNTVMKRVNVETGEIISLTAPEEELTYPTQVRVYALDSDNPTQMAIGLNWRDGRIFDLYRLDVETGDLKLIAEGKPEMLRWCLDAGLNIRGYLLSEDDGGQSFWLREDGRYRMAIDWTIDDDASWPVAFVEGENKAYLFDSRGRNARALVLHDFDNGQQQVLVEDDEYDVDMTIANPETHAIEAVAVAAERIEWHAINKEYQEDIEYLTKAKSGDFLLASRTNDNQTWLVRYRRADGPTMFYLYDRKAKRLTTLFSARDALLNEDLVSMEAYEFTARDGKKISGYLTRPAGAEGPLPTVLLVHSSAWARNYWGFHPESQWLANRGYACLRVNARGVMGLGKRHMNAGNREWNGVIQDDLEDAVRWAIESNITDPARVVIYGGSFGGYSALMGMTRPDTYKAAIAVQGMIELEEYLSSIPPYLESFRTNLNRRVGYVPRYTNGKMAGKRKKEADLTKADREELMFLHDNSPYYQVEKMHGSMMIVQGGRDRLVRKSLADEFVRRLKFANIDVEYVVYDQEGHGIVSTGNRLDLYRRVEKFLGEQLGGLVEE